MLTKEIVDYDDTATAFPFKLSMDISDGLDDVDIDTYGVVYYSSLDGYTEPHTLTSAGTGTIHQDEYLLFEGIPVGVNIYVEEPTVSNTNYTPNTTGNANCYMEYDIHTPIIRLKELIMAQPADTKRSLLILNRLISSP